MHLACCWWTGHGHSSSVLGKHCKLQLEPLPAYLLDISWLKQLPSHCQTAAGIWSQPCLPQTADQLQVVCYCSFPFLHDRQQQCHACCTGGCLRHVGFGVVQYAVANCRHAVYHAHEQLLSCLQAHLHAPQVASDIKHQMRNMQCQKQQQSTAWPGANLQLLPPTFSLLRAS